MMTKQEEIEKASEIVKNAFGRRPDFPSGKDYVDGVRGHKQVEGVSGHKQEEIQRYFEDILSKAWRLGRDGQGIDVTEEANQVRVHLTKWGVVLKVERELPKTYFANRKKMPWITDYDVEVCAQQDMLKAGYAAIEPLIEGG